MISEAIQQLLAANSDLTDDLATYAFTTGSDTPAIFTTQVIARDSELPALRIEELGGDGDTGTREKMGADSRMRITGFADKHDEATIRSIAWKVFKLVNRADLTSYMTGWQTVFTLADPPQDFEDEDGFPGFVLNLRAVVLET